VAVKATFSVVVLVAGLLSACSPHLAPVGLPEPVPAAVPVQVPETPAAVPDATHPPCLAYAPEEESPLFELWPEDYIIDDGLDEMVPMELGQEDETEPDKGISFDIPIVVNDRVEFWLDYFSRKQNKAFARWLSRSSKYVPMMKEILKDHGLPEDLVYLAMIESGFNPNAYSRRRASGPWQFIYGTGKRYGLRVNWWLDERRNPEKSTLAAARYLKDLYDQFSCWYLAAAGYNAGAGKISRAIRRYRTEDFWELARHRYLKRETKNYVPKMIAAALIAKDPETYGFTDIMYEDPICFEKVSIPDATDLRVIARCCGTDFQTIKVLNPELRRWCTPPNYPDYQVTIPCGAREHFLTRYAQIDPSERLTFRRHKVRSGETLSHIARRYRTGIQPIMQMNRISNPRRIRAGSYLIIPIPARTTYASAKTPKPESVVVAQAHTSIDQDGTCEKVVYVVKEGDTLWNIARRHNLTLEDIKRWNKIRGTLIHPKDTLLLKVKKEETS
jgi:membrane-bound lytic murein transglycosylase D